jgi:hypothetical protein
MNLRERGAQEYERLIGVSLDFYDRGHSPTVRSVRSGREARLTGLLPRSVNRVRSLDSEASGFPGLQLDHVLVVESPADARRGAAA